MHVYTLFSRNPEREVWLNFRHLRVHYAVLENAWCAGRSELVLIQSCHWRLTSFIQTTHVFLWLLVNPSVSVTHVECTERWCTEANEATQTHCYNPVAPAYLIWAYYAHGRQSRCQEDPVGLPSGRLEKTTGSSPHHMAQHHPTGSETSPSYASWSSRFGSEPPSVEDDVDVWRYTTVSCLPETTNDDVLVWRMVDNSRSPHRTMHWSTGLSLSILVPN